MQDAQVNNCFWTDEFKVVLMGPPGAGKTYLLTTWITQQFPDDCEFDTIPACVSRFLSIHGRDIRLNIWDTASMEKFKSLTKTFSRNAAAILVVYDASDENSLEQAKIIFTEEQGKKLRESLLYLIANKADVALPELISEGKKYAESRNSQFYEVSGPENVLLLFNNVIDSVVKIGLCEQVPSQEVTVRLEPPAEEYVSPCCL